MSMKLMEAIAAAATECAKCNSDDAVAATPEEMADFGNRYLKKHEFKPGDLVMWKKEMKETNWPGYGVPSVVLEVVPGRRDAKDDELRELLIGCKIFGGKYSSYWFNANRFEPYRAKTPVQEKAPEEPLIEKAPA